MLLNIWVFMKGEIIYSFSYLVIFGNTDDAKSQYSQIVLRGVFTHNKKPEKSLTSVIRFSYVLGEHFQWHSFFVFLISLISKFQLNNWLRSTRILSFSTNGIVHFCVKSNKAYLEITSLVWIYYWNKNLESKKLDSKQWTWKKKWDSQLENSL